MKSSLKKILIFGLPRTKLWTFTSPSIADFLTMPYRSEWWPIVSYLTVHQ
jgi:hypothetical protein